MAAEAVQRVYKRRMDFIRSIFSEAGFSGADLEMRTMLFVAYHTSERTTFCNVSDTKLRRLRKAGISLLTTPLS